MLRLVPTGVALLVLLSQGPLAQTSPQVPRDPVRPAPAGTSAIHGRVVRADTGQPIRWASVSLGIPGRGPLVTSTDADGRYRLADLPPGRYVMTASKPGFVTLSYGARSPGQLPSPILLAVRQTVEADFALPPGGAVEGRILTAEGEPLQNVSVQASRLAYGNGLPRLVIAAKPARTDDRGRFRVHSLPPGEYLIQVTPEMLPPLPQGDEVIQRPRDFATTYYPGAALEDAQRVTVAAGQAIRVEFAVASIALATVVLQISDSSGRVPASAGATLQYTNGITFAGRSASGRSDFIFTDVPAGVYRVIASAHTPGADPEFAIADVRVSGEDVPLIPIRTAPGATDTGRLEVDEGAPSITPSGMAIVAVSTAMPAIVADPHVPSSPTRIDAEGRFEMKSLFGPRLFRMPRLSAPWALKRVLLDGRDVTDTPVDFRAGPEPRQLRVVITNQTGAVSGTVRTETGGPALDARVVLFPAAEALWRGDSRFIRTSARVQIDGAFSVDALLPGEYLAAAAENLREFAWFDPEVLRHLRRTASRVSVKPLATTTLHLRVPNP